MSCGTRGLPLGEFGIATRRQVVRKRPGRARLNRRKLKASRFHPVPVRGARCGQGADGKIVGSLTLAGGFAGSRDLRGAQENSTMSTFWSDRPVLVTGSTGLVGG